MFISKLISLYEAERNQPPESINYLLDFYKRKYVTQEIDIVEYFHVLAFLDQRGAVSAHEYKEIK